MPSKCQSLSTITAPRAANTSWNGLLSVLQWFLRSRKAVPPQTWDPQHFLLCSQIRNTHKPVSRVLANLSPFLISNTSSIFAWSCPSFHGGRILRYKDRPSKPTPIVTHLLPEGQNYSSKTTPPNGTTSHGHIQTTTRWEGISWIWTAPCWGIEPWIKWNTESKLSFDRYTYSFILCSWQWMPLTVLSSCCSNPLLR